MKNIGVVLPYHKKYNFFKEFFKSNSFEKIFIEEYEFNFIVVNDRQNCSKIFNKNGIEHIVLLTDCEIESCDFEILNGDKAFVKMLPEYVRKTVKKFGNNCSAVVVDRSMSEYGIIVADKLCEICRSVSINTQNLQEGEKICEKFLDKYGIVIDIIGDGKPIKADIIVVLEDCGNTYEENCIIIDKNSNKKSPNIVTDFYIPFRVKPPLGMSNLIFLECIDINNC